VLAALLFLGLATFAVAYWRSDNDCVATRAATPPHPMRAVVYCDYGGPDVLAIDDLERPAPGPGQVLVRVKAASVNPLESHYMRGEPYLMRLQEGLRKPKTIQLGVDFAGVVEAVGAEVQNFKPGDEVFGGRNGALAEFVVVAAARNVVTKPANISFAQAAAVPVAAVTALQAVRDRGRVSAGQRVLVNGASGGVGTFAVQIAKTLGATVTGVSSGRNVELVRSLGADRT
jgi:NADPH:quinone reductase-like Zn-dependent oxidoreductase